MHGPSSYDDRRGAKELAARWRAGNLLVIARRWIEPQGYAASLPRIPAALRRPLSSEKRTLNTQREPFRF
jgi:hypothetical protein